MDSALWKWDAVDLANAIRTRRISSREATLACLKRLEEVNPRINAVIEIRAEEALATADRADDQVRKGAPVGALHGVPVTTKVNVDQAGSATTGGVVAFGSLIAAEDNPVISNLRRAGAVILGRTNAPAFSWRWFTDNALHGRTLNPWDPSLTPGGSSGGAAAAVATGIGPLAHGSDLGGSIRYPAYACGVFGMRATLGRIPACDPSAPADRPVLSQLYVSQGPLARSVRDVRLMLGALSKPDVRDPWYVPMPFDNGRDEGPIQVALLDRAGALPVDPLVTEVLQRAAEALSDAGYEVEAATPPHLDELRDLWLALMTEAQFGYLQRIAEFGDAAIRKSVTGMLACAPQLDFAGYLSKFSRRTFVARAWSLFLERHPLLLMPVSWQRPFPVDFDQQGDATVAQIVSAQTPLFPANVLGLPALAAPTGVVNGTPTGVQLVAGRFKEDLCLRAAEVIEACCGRYTPTDPHEAADRRKHAEPLAHN